jgi:hypothetical protein
MPTSDEYDVRVRTAVEAFFPTLSPEAKSAVVWLIVDVLLSLDRISA